MNADIDNHVAKLKLLLAAAAGAFSYLLQYRVFAGRGSVFDRDLSAAAYAQRHAFIEFLWQIFQLMQNFLFICIVAAIFAALAVYNYRRRDAWLYAFLAGRALPHILLRLF